MEYIYTDGNKKAKKKKNKKKTTQHQKKENIIPPFQKNPITFQFLGKLIISWRANFNFEIPMVFEKKHF